MRLSATVLGAIFAAGCSTTPRDPCAPETPVEHITLRSPGAFEQLGILDGRIFGPYMDVTRYDDTYRGLAFRRYVDLRLHDDLIVGTVGAGRTELHIRRHPDGFSMQGLYGGNLGRLHVHSNQISGWLGGRSYRLRQSAVDPSVYTSDGGSLDPSVPLSIAYQHVGNPTELTLPPSFATMPTEHQALMLALLFGR